ncbi:glycosyltransferase [Roseomonas sp. BN140053]|uniref:glycosyltransferase n=1 Tax=Roseomonas sp. BN140053 TaxID=3391898 RepID=UPI0039EB1367
MPRLHMFTPLPPARNGVADYAASLLEALSAHYDCVAHAEAPAEPPAGVRLAEDDPPPFARVLHQLGNSAGHAAVLRAMRRVPGVVTLHDLTLAVPVRLAAAGAEAGLRDAMRAASPALADTLGREWLDTGGQAGAAAAVFDLVAQGLRDARAVVVHSRYALNRLRQLHPALAGRCAVIPHLAQPASADRAAARAALRLPPHRFILLTAGFPARAKRLDWVAEAVAEALRRRADLLWIHAGEGDAAAIAPALAASGHLRATGYLTEESLAQHVAACNALANLRAPSVGESSGTLARALAAGRCTLVSGVAAYAELPVDAALHLPALGPQQPLAEALVAMAAQPGLADLVGERAARYARTALDPDAVARAYRDVIEEFRAAPPLRAPGPLSAAGPLQTPGSLHAPGVSRRAPPKLLIVSPMAPWPVRAGNAARLRALGEALAARGLPAELACPVDGEASTDHRAALGRGWAALHPLPWRTRPMPSHPDRWALDDWCPDSTVEAVAALHGKHRYDAVIASYTWLSAVLEAVPGALRLLDTHDLVGGRREAALTAGLAPSWYWTGLAEESRGLDRADLVLGIQPAESEVLRGRTGRPVLTVGHAPPLRFGEGAEPPGPWPFGTLASANVWNTRALEALDDALARIEAEGGPELPWLVAGDAAVPRRFRSAGTAIGPVRDAEEVYRLIRCAVNPMEGGTGLKIKTVEALCFGRPVIGTSDAFAGLPTTHPAQQAIDAAEVAAWMTEHERSAGLRDELLAGSQQLARDWHAEVAAGLDVLAATLRRGAV